MKRMIAGPPSKNVRRPALILLTATVTMLSTLSFAVARTASSGSPQATRRQTRVAQVADFNADGFGDLAVGVFGESVNGQSGAGAVNVFYGSPTGLQVTGTGGPDDQFWTEDMVNGNDGVSSGDAFGSSLEAGDFDGDGVADLAVGIRAEDVGSAGEAGAVAVIYGTAGTGLTSAGSQWWSQNSPGVKDTSDAGDHMGSSLADGDFNGDGFDDLAIGTDFEGFGSLTKAGAVDILYGSDIVGLQATGTGGPDDQFWTQNSTSVKETSEANDRFGRELDAGDFNADGFDDLAVGTHFESAGTVDNAGSVNLLYGSATGVQSTGTGGPDDQLWTQGRNGVKDSAEKDDRFGSALASGDFNDDGIQDLAVGVRLEDIDPFTDSGAVEIIYGTTCGLNANPNTCGSNLDDSFFIQDDLGGQGTEGTESDDWFGYSLSADDYDGDGFTDLTAGARFEDVDTIVDGGAVNIIYGSPTGLTATGSQYFTQNTTGIAGDGSETSDEMGVWSDGADFNGDGFADVGVDVWLEDVNSTIDAGAVNVIYGSLGVGLQVTGTGGPNDQYWNQDVANVAGDGAEFDDEFGWTDGAT